MSKRRTITVGNRAEAFTGPGIDPRSEAIAVYHVPGERTASDTPARDLNGGDLDRIAYNRAFRAADGERPGPISPEDLAALAEELVASGAFSLTPALEDEPPTDGDAPATPDATPAGDDPAAGNDAITTTTTEPEQPAEAPEV